MSWLIDRVTGNPMLLIYVSALMLILGAAGGSTLVWNYEQPRIKLVKSEYAGFVAQTKLMGKAAQKELAAKDAANKATKERLDHENKTTVDALLADIAILQHNRSSGRFVPPASPGAKRPERACFDRAKLESAIQLLDAEVQGVLTQCDVTRLKLDTAKVWSHER